MASRDPKAIRAGVHYEGGHVTACLGLIEALFGTGNLDSPTELTKGTKPRLKNVVRRKGAVGGKQIYFYMRDGRRYMAHYGGRLRDFRKNGVPKLSGDVVRWSTARGTEQYVYN